MINYNNKDIDGITTNPSDPRYAYSNAYKSQAFARTDPLNNWILQQIFKGKPPQAFARCTVHSKFLAWSQAAGGRGGFVDSDRQVHGLHGSECKLTKFEDMNEMLSYENGGDAKALDYMLRKVAEITEGLKARRPIQEDRYLGD